jgi:hypothetical protein
MYKSKIDEDRQTDRETAIKHRGSYHTFFLLKGQFGKSKITASKVMFE